MNDPKDAIHSIRNDLTPILWFAQLANNGDREAQRLVIKELVKRSDSINEELDVLTTAVRHRQLPGAGTSAK
jgi:hypothetical protein